MSEAPSKKDLLRKAVDGLAASLPRGKCLDEPELIRFYGGGLPEERADEIRDHIIACPACLALAREAREFLAARETPAAAARSMARPRGRRFLLRAAAAVLIAGGVGWGMWLTRGPTIRTLRLQGDFPAVVRADYHELQFRGESPPLPAGAGAANFADAMRAYQRGDDATAERELEGYLMAHPMDHEALFYRGVSLILLKRYPEGAVSLQAAQASDDEWIRDEASWYLALTQLRMMRLSDARATLDALLARGKHRLEEALRLRKALGD